MLNAHLISSMSALGKSNSWGSTLTFEKCYHLINFQTSFSFITMLLSEVESEAANKLLISTMMSLPALSEGTKEDG